MIWQPQSANGTCSPRSWYDLGISDRRRARAARRHPPALTYNHDSVLSLINSRPLVYLVRSDARQCRRIQLSSIGVAAMLSCRKLTGRGARSRQPATLHKAQVFACLVLFDFAHFRDGVNGEVSHHQDVHHS